jgi:hypothetical protein
MLAPRISPAAWAMALKLTWMPPAEGLRTEGEAARIAAFHPQSVRRPCTPSMRARGIARPTSSALPISPTLSLRCVRDAANGSMVTCLSVADAVICVTARGEDVADAVAAFLATGGPAVVARRVASSILLRAAEELRGSTDALVAATEAGADASAIRARATGDGRQGARRAHGHPREQSKGGGGRTAKEYPAVDLPGHPSQRFPHVRTTSSVASSKPSSLPAGAERACSAAQASPSRSLTTPFARTFPSWPTATMNGVPLTS